ncbi:WhiB family redox-sensing transcriptional regulator [Streptomyces sp. CG 926]|uniref:WhiB family transcriptional regulator n=1 Tax=unclassified Streptomyces TaxID=2593676 RepID=UPI000D6B5836|nr:WhiB family transcriptional regulator [Streptomyces sp. CG 926]PWK64874.1 WhiB family redox-sensing transcriptional regulator [Streptomyces sp. CG 926]
MTKVARLPGRAEHQWEWQEEAACRALGTDRFFHPAGERGEERAAREQEAKEVCAFCPVRSQCLSHALRVQEPYGVWGGLTEDERRELGARKAG